MAVKDMRSMSKLFNLKTTFLSLKNLRGRKEWSRRGLRSSKTKLRVKRLIRLSRRSLKSWSRIKDIKKNLRRWRRWSMIGLRSSKSNLRVKRLIKLSRKSLNSWSRIKDYKRSFRAWKRWSMIGLRSSKTRLRVLHRQSLFKSK